MNKSSANGFTLVELVATIIILGIISVSVAPKFFGRSGFAEYALQDQARAFLRVAQQRAMYDHSGACYGVEFNSTLMRVVQDDALLAEHQLDFDNDYAGFGVNNGGANVYFDGLGNALSGVSCAAPPVAFNTDVPATRVLTITGGAPLTITVHSSGYIQ